MEQPDANWLPDHIGQEFYYFFLGRAGGDSTLATRLFEHDKSIRSALRTELEYVEEALRRHYHRVMCRLHHHGPAWIHDPALRTFDVMREHHGKVLRALIAGSISPEIAITRVNFGFWRQLTAARLEKSLWVPYLHRAYPPGTDRAVAHDTVVRAVDLRNKVSHLNFVINQPLKANWDDILWLLDNTSPDLAAQRRKSSQLPRLIDHLNAAE